MACIPQSGDIQYPMARERLTNAQKYGVLAEQILHATYEKHAFDIVKSNIRRFSQDLQQDDIRLSFPGGPLPNGQLPIALMQSRSIPVFPDASLLQRVDIDLTWKDKSRTRTTVFVENTTIFSSKSSPDNNP